MARVPQRGGLEPEGRRLRAWIAAGRHGAMEYMSRTLEVRLDPRGLLPRVASVIVLALSHARREHGGEPLGPAPGRIAAYARGRDYHNFMRKRARAVARLLCSRGHEARATVDALPMLERAWAERAGVGFSGKNCCTIVPGVGSHVLVATVLTSAELEPDEPMRPRCGDCRACLDACPTHAFVGARELDARRCISYLTIENRGPVPKELSASFGDRIFGCDACQDVCPFNRGVLLPETPASPFAIDRRWLETDAATFLRLDDASFRRSTEGTPLRRPGRIGLARNAAIVLGNVGGEVHLSPLARAAREDPAPTVRDAASAGLARLRERLGLG